MCCHGELLALVQPNSMDSRKVWIYTAVGIHEPLTQEVGPSLLAQCSGAVSDHQQVPCMPEKAACEGRNLYRH